MNKKIAKYFWDLNDPALREAEKILKKPEHPEFSRRLVRFLSRCQKPRELFSFITKEKFVEVWPQVRRYWVKAARESDFRDWWQTIYEWIAAEHGVQKRMPKGRAPALFLRVGMMIRDARIRKGMSQSELALRAGMKQPDISKIEEGKKNITIGTLSRLCGILGLKKIALE